MLLLDDIEIPDYERVVRMSDDTVGMHGFIAVHSTARGSSLGGLRIREYESPEDALQDVLNLSEAMTYKSAAAGLPFGGGKAVVIGEPSQVKTPQMLEQYGHAVQALDGAYITAEDVGTTVSDLAQVAKVTRWVAGLPAESGGSGDPSPATAKGVLMAMRAVAAHVWDQETLEGRRVLVQGLGKVGTELVQLLCDEGAEMLVADVRPNRAEAAAAICDRIVPIPSETCLGEQADIFAPCALGGVLSSGSIGQLRCRAVVGSANNQLTSPDAATTLAELGIIYVPDFIANAGGIINIASEYGYTQSDVEDALRRIGDTTREILEAAETHDKTTLEVAMDIARQRMDSAVAP